LERIILERFETSDQGTFGKIRIENETIYTLELPWRDNSNDLSCIPAGVYQCHFTMSPRFHRRMYLVDGVNKRTGIRIHSANLAGDRTLGLKAQLNGCIALGLAFGKMDGQKCIVLSKPAVRKFESIMDQNSFVLEIINGY
jgi:hypothetical protein